jgi:hypothetical protein
VSPETDCFVCRKHRGELVMPGGVVYEDELVYASHMALPDGQERVYLGTLFVEPKRHVPGMGDLHRPEAERVGWLSRLAAALQACATRAASTCDSATTCKPASVLRYPGTPGYTAPDCRLADARRGNTRDRRALRPGARGARRAISRAVAPSAVSHPITGRGSLQLFHRAMVMARRSSEGSPQRRLDGTAAAPPAPRLSVGATCSEHRNSSNAARGEQSVRAHRAA